MAQTQRNAPNRCRNYSLTAGYGRMSADFILARVFHYDNPISRYTIPTLTVPTI